MNTSLYTSLVSMGALQQKLDIIAKNVANVNTTGYKRREASFEDLLTTTINQQKEFQLNGRLTPPGLNRGHGIRVDEIQMIDEQGQFTRTDNTFDLSIEGNGYFEIEIAEDSVENGQGADIPRAGYTRDGSFQLSRSSADPNFNFLVNAQGRHVRDVNNQRIQIPYNAQNVKIDEKGFVSAQLPNGQILDNFTRVKVVRVLKPKMLEHVGDNLFVLPRGTAVNDPQMVRTLQMNRSTDEPVLVRQGYLETSNVNLSTEMTELINTQRSFQLLSRSLTMSDTMMGMVNNLRV
jgi:flagellar basal-body rod protein FlgG